MYFNPLEYDTIQFQRHCQCSVFHWVHSSFHRALKALSRASDSILARFCKLGHTLNQLKHQIECSTAYIYTRDVFHVIVRHRAHDVVLHTELSVCSYLWSISHLQISWAACFHSRHTLSLWLAMPNTRGLALSGTADRSTRLLEATRCVSVWQLRELAKERARISLLESISWEESMMITCHGRLLGPSRYSSSINWATEAMTLKELSISRARTGLSAKGSLMENVLNTAGETTLSSLTAEQRVWPTLLSTSWTTVSCWR